MTGKNALKACPLPDVAPGRWSSPEGREMAERYVGQSREGLCHGELSDFELANRQYLASRDDIDLVAWQTAAKDRIRWLSTQLAAAEARNTRASGSQEVAGELAKLLEQAPEPYEYMTKADFRALPVTMRGFIDAHRSWVQRLAKALPSAPGEGK